MQDFVLLPCAFKLPFQVVGFLDELGVLRLQFVDAVHQVINSHAKDHQHACGQADEQVCLGIAFLGSGSRLHRSRRCLLVAFELPLPDGGSDWLLRTLRASRRRLRSGFLLGFLMCGLNFRGNFLR